MKEIRIVCDSPPGPNGCTFIEAENERGESVSLEWRERPDGKWELVIPLQ